MEKEAVSNHAPRMLPLSQIHVDTRPWQVRRVIVDSEIEILMRAIQSTGYVTPIVVCARPDGAFDLIQGRYRLEAVLRLGHESIPAVEEEAGDDLSMMTRAFTEDSPRFPLRHIERGWALLKLEHLLEELNIEITLAELNKYSGIDMGTISSARKAGRAMPEMELRAIADVHGVAWTELAQLPRDPARILADLDPNERVQRLADVCEAIQTGASRTTAVHGPDKGTPAPSASPPQPVKVRQASESTSVHLVTATIIWHETRSHGIGPQAPSFIYAFPDACKASIPGIRERLIRLWWMIWGVLPIRFRSSVSSFSVPGHRRPR